MSQVISSPLSIACPLCGAGPGNRCTRQGRAAAGTERERMHQRRWQAFYLQRGATAPVAAPPEPGQLLPNGRVLVAIRLLGEKEPSWAGDLHAVLALTGHGHDLYAVWTFVHVLDGSQPSFCYAGSYLADFDAALEDWRARKAPA